MQVVFAHVGFGNDLAAQRVRTVLSPLTAPAKRLVQAAGEHGLLIDMTGGRRTRAVIVMEQGYLALVALTPEALLDRLNAALSGQTEVTPASTGK